MSPRRRPPLSRVEPPLLAYSFESCPEEKLSSCCDYEYLASSEFIRDAVERNRAGQNDPKAQPDPAAQADPTAHAVPLLFGPDIFWTRAEGLWPRPYLELLRDRRPPSTAGASPPRARRRSFPVLAKLVIPWDYLLDAKEAERVVPVYINPHLPLPWLLKAIRELLLTDYPHLLRTGSSESQLKDAFADLWRRKDPEAYADFVQSEGAFHRRGRGSRIEQARADLKALGAWRLCKQFGYTPQAAIDLMHAHRLDAYQDVRSLRRALRRATRKIAKLEDLLRQYSQMGTA